MPSSKKKKAMKAIVAKRWSKCKNDLRETEIQQKNNDSYFMCNLGTQFYITVDTFVKVKIKWFM